MSKSVIMISIDSGIKEQSSKRLKGSVSRICEDALRKELNIVEQAPSELVELEKLIAIKQDVQRLALLENGETAIRVIAREVRQNLGHEPLEPSEKINFWQEVHQKAKLLLMKARFNKEKESSKEKEGVGLRKTTQKA